MNGLQTLCEESSIPMDEIERPSHGTAVGTNALIQRTGGTVALVTTYGFKDLLEIGRQTCPHMYDRPASACAAFTTTGTIDSAERDAELR